jgi:SnoaL-like domain
MEGRTMNEQREIEAIKSLKYSYFRNVDQKNLDAIEQQLLPECSTAYHGGRYGNPDRATTMAFLRAALGPQVLTLHQAHHPEIELLSATEARGRWYMHDIVINLQEHTRLEGNGFFEDRYRKVDGEWKFLHTGYHRTFALTQPLGQVVDLYNAFARESAQ